jgi:F0F1-type ATP synthase assembly protein I
VPEQHDDHPEGGRPSFTLGTLAGLGLANAISLGVGLALGHLLDGWLGTAPLMVLLGMTLGLVLGIVGSVLEIRRYLQD